MGHGNTSCDPHLHQSHQATNAPLPHAKRLPHGRLRSNEQTGHFRIFNLARYFSSSQVYGTFLGSPQYNRFSRVRKAVTMNWPKLIVEYGQAAAWTAIFLSALAILFVATRTKRTLPRKLLSVAS